MDVGFERYAFGMGVGFARRGCRDVSFDAGVAAVQHGAGVVREEGEGGAGVWFLACSGKGGGVPDVV